MSVSRVFQALRDVLTVGDSSSSQAVPASDIPPVPIAEPGEVSWRTHQCLHGPYLRFSVRYPRDWHTISPHEGDLVHLLPDARSGLDLSVTFSSDPIEVAGPQALLDTIELLAQDRELLFRRSSVRLDRWGDDGWAGSFAWNEREVGGRPRPWRLLAVGHDHCLVLGMATGSAASMKEQEELVERVLASVQLSSSDLLAPEFFPTAICQLLNDRLAAGEPTWDFNDDGLLDSGSLRVRLHDLYRAYLLHGDLDRVAAALDTRARNELQDCWDGCTWDEAQVRLRVVLRKAETLRELPVVKVPLSGGLVACPVLDSEDRIHFIPTAESDRWGLSPEALLDQAVSVMDSSGPVSLMEVLEQDTGNLWGVQLADRDGYDSGRLLCPQLRASIEQILGGPLIVALPAAGLILVTRDTQESREDLATTAGQAYTRRPRPLSRAVWKWTPEGLEPVMG